MELREALTQIAEIRQHMARGQVFRGYRAATTAFSGVIAIAGALIQPALIPSPAVESRQFVWLWAAAAGICLVAVGIEMVVRTCRQASAVQKQLTLQAVEQFMPSVVAGGLLAWVFYDFVPALIWMLPGLWMILFALGMFASARLLPRAIFAVAGFYLLAGMFVLMVTGGGDAWRYSPWVMGGVFGAGQFATAAILYMRLERSHGG